MIVSRRVSLKFVVIRVEILVQNLFHRLMKVRTKAEKGEMREVEIPPLPTGVGDDGRARCEML